MAGAGYAILRNGALAGWTGEEGALGADLLTGDAPGRILEFAAPSLAQTALRLTEVKTELTPSFTDGVLAGLAVTCRIEAQVAELRGRTDSARRAGYGWRNALRRQVRRLSIQRWTWPRPWTPTISTWGGKPPWRRPGVRQSWKHSGKRGLPRSQSP